MNDIAFESFDFSRAILSPNPPYQSTPASTLRPVSELLADGKLTLDSPLLVMTLGETSIAFSTLQLVYHHVIQGEFKGQHWLASFCSICNGGSAFSPVVDGQVYTFSERGYYDAMILLYDSQTDSYWDHLRGICLYGASQGKKLQRLSNLLHMNVKQALAAYPDVSLAQTVLSPEQEAESVEDDEWRRESNPAWSGGLTATLGVEDPRLSRLTTGLGVWSEQTRRYYQLNVLHAQNNAIIDSFDGRRLLVYVDSGTPGAFFTTTTEARWERETLVLNNGLRLEEGVLLDKNNVRQTAIERPLQLFSRWYAFAIKFGGSDIYVHPSP